MRRRPGIQLSLLPRSCCAALAPKLLTILKMVWTLMLSDAAEQSRQRAPSVTQRERPACTLRPRQPGLLGCLALAPPKQALLLRAHVHIQLYGSGGRLLPRRGRASPTHAPPPAPA